MYVMQNNSFCIDKSEYSNIAQAHFKSNETISAFFKYYLIIISIPITLFGGLAKLNGGVENIINKNIYLFNASFLIAFVGFFIYWYVVNLRLDAVLYARTVNGIRKYFYDNSKLHINTKLGIKVLPLDINFPPFCGDRHFLPVVLAMAFVNSLYMFGAVKIFYSDLFMEGVYFLFIEFY